MSHRFSGIALDYDECPRCKGQTPILHRYNSNFLCLVCIDEEKEKEDSLLEKELIDALIAEV